MKRSFHFLSAVTFLFSILITTLNASIPSSRNQDQHASIGLWKSLQRGNKMYIHNKKFARQRAYVAGHQNPHVVVLGCSDSRVTPEFIFNKKIGELFVIRTAGNVADDADIDSINYSLGHHETHLIVVMGHTHCGAVEGAIDHLKKNNGKIDPENGTLNAVLIPIEKCIVANKIDIYAPDAVEKSVRANVHCVAYHLIRRSPDIKNAVNSGRVAIIGAEYSLETGNVKELFRIEKF